MKKRKKTRGKEVEEEEAKTVSDYKYTAYF